MNGAGKRIGLRKRFLALPGVVGILMLTATFFATGWLSLAYAYVVSGTVTNNSGKTGRVYLFVNDSGGFGTSIDTSGAFSISGVPPGTHTITAVMDSRGDGKLFATDPIGISSSFTIFSANVSSIAVLLTNPSTPAPPTPSWLKVFPGDGCAAMMWDIKANTQPYLPIADHYNLYWSTSPGVAPGNTPGGGSRLGIPHPGYGPFFLPGLTSGVTLYFVVTAMVNGAVGTPSPVYGPVTIATPPGPGVPVQGNVSLSGFTPAGPLCVGLYGGDSFFVECFPTPSPIQPFRFDNVPDGYYQVIAGVDMNNNGVGDPGDIGVGGLAGSAPSILVQGAPLSGVAIPLTSSAGDAGVYTEYIYQNQYTLFFEAKNNHKLITNVTVISGPSLTEQIDMPWDDGYFDTWGFGLPGRPNIGDTYTLAIRYADGIVENKPVAITDILDGYPTPVSPSGTVSGTTPLITWNPPVPLPAQNPFLYYIKVKDGTGSDVWNPNIPSNRTHASYNEDGTAVPLVSGNQYHWHVEVKDQHGNRSTGPSVNFTPTATAWKQLTVLSRNPASGVSITVTPDDLNNFGNGSSPFTRDYNASTSVALTPPLAVGANGFSRWTGCDSVSGNICTVAMCSDRNVIADFTLAPLARIGTTPYDTLQAAYHDAAPSGTVIMLREGDPGPTLGTLNANEANKNVTLQGGYDAAYLTHTGSTVIMGPVTMSSGTVVFDNLGVK